ncbi:glycerol-3-phosphate responsive antiterminator [Paraliobacillus ryukyuensis]|uniref:glycerol-3-phosphate responsive antiterminator n=1 Tax=Paraliobacillus ryukyuensis TaxID=200904 RepID=UPI0009A7A314|nr:glycerol-3-phosphate responsive antiterminator [Paraliobacillus ryukyuensis]
MKLEGVLPAVRDMKDFDSMLSSQHELFILLDTRVSQLPYCIKQAKKANKKVLVHADMINGLKVDKYGMEFLVRLLKVDGIISTRANAISLAKKFNTTAVLRLFAIDSSAMEKNMKLVEQTKPDYIEILPGVVPSIIKDVIDQTAIPVIAGGLIRTKDNVNQALDSGAIAVTTTSKELYQNGL